VIDGDERTFWVTTGMFPQEIVVSLGTAANVASVTIRSVGLRRISMHSCASEQPTSYEAVMPETELADRGESAHVQSFALKIPQARHVKLIIHEGYSHFVAVNSIALES
jgi:heat shock protein beta-11